MVSSLLRLTVMTLRSVGTSRVELLSKIFSVELPVTVMSDVAVPKVVFHTPIASVPALRMVDFQELAPA